MRRRRSLWLMASILGGVLGVTAGAVQAGIRVNLSPSMPRGIYRLVDCDESAGRDADVGDLVAIDTRKALPESDVAFFRDRGWLSYSGRRDDLLMKKVVGVGGDEITESGGRLCINGRRLDANASTRQRSLGSLDLPSVDLPLRIESGEVWISSNHAEGIDSRYFGPIARSSIACKVEPAWML